MRTYAKDNWKKKIDPAFDKVIRNYVTFISAPEKSPKEGTLNLPEGFIEPLTNTPDWQDSNVT